MNPLRMLRHLCEDPELTTNEFAILAATLIFTDNKTGRVKNSQQVIAEAAKTSRMSVTRCLRRHGDRYFTSVSNRRQRDLTWIECNIECNNESHTVLHSVQHGEAPSTSIYRSTSTSSLDGASRLPSSLDACGTTGTTQHESGTTQHESAPVDPQELLASEPKPESYETEEEYLAEHIAWLDRMIEGLG